MKQMPMVDRPREKLLRYRSASRLKTEELFAIILGTGRKGENVLSLARKILKIITEAEPSSLFDTLIKTGGMGNTKTCQILSVIELRKRLNSLYEAKDILSPADIWKDMLPTHTSKKEHFIVYYLDTRNSIIKKELISLGSLNASIVHPREVFEPAVRNLCAHIILSHNHPSGDSAPSEADILVTKKLQNAGKILDIEVLDHVIVCEKGFTSMKEMGLMG